MHPRAYRVETLAVQNPVLAGSAGHGTGSVCSHMTAVKALQVYDGRIPQIRRVFGRKYFREGYCLAAL
jgi:hypothetical protein